MRAEIILQRQLEHARKLMGSRDNPVAKAARRAFGSTVIVLDAWRNRGELRPYIEAALRAGLIVDALNHRAQRASNRQRARRLAAAAPQPAQKVSDADITTALLVEGGGVRRAARRLGVSPSTVSRRNVACRDGAQHPRRASD